MAQRVRYAQTMRLQRTPCMPAGLRENIARMHFFDFSCSVAVAPVYIPACWMTDTPMDLRPATHDGLTSKSEKTINKLPVKPGSFLCL